SETRPSHPDAPLHERGTMLPEAASRPGSFELGSEDVEWEFSATAMYYAISRDRDLLVPVLTADHGALHLEVRHNYEAEDATSGWVGGTFSLGEELKLDATLMGGVVGGRIQGGVAGYEANLRWKMLELYSEGEVVVSIQDRHDDFLYAWSELSVYPLDW